MLDKFTNRLRYFIELSYNGSDFHGWQSQPNAITVQETIENSLQLILKNKELKSIFNNKTYLKNINVIYNRIFKK